MAEQFTSLTGRWLGRYDYARGAAAPVAFEAELTDDQGTIAGETTEPNTFRPDLGVVLSAVLHGSRNGPDVTLAKTYLQFSEGPPIAYIGVANAKLTRIEGRWHFPDMPSEGGRFVLMRKPAALARALRQVLRDIEAIFTAAR